MPFRLNVEQGLRVCRKRYLPRVCTLVPSFAFFKLPARCMIGEWIRVDAVMLGERGFADN